MTARSAIHPDRESLRRRRAVPSIALALMLLGATAGPAGASVLAPIAYVPTVGFVLGGTLGTGQVPVRISWPAATAGTSTLARYDLERRADTGPWSTVALPSPLSTSVVLTLRPGRLHQFRLRAFDATQTASSWATAGPVWLDAAQEDDLDLAYSGSWSRVASTSAFGKALSTSSQAGATAGLSFTASEVAWVSTRGPTRGRATASTTGQPDETVDLYRTSSQSRRIVYVGRLGAPGTGSIGIRVEGTPTRPRVDVDAVLTLGPAPVSVLLGAGDIAKCDSTGDEATADLVESLPGIVFTAGDNAYGYGSAHDYADCYAPSWGRFEQRTRPSPGNHEYLTPAASAYFAYFGAVAGRPGAGWYAYDLGTWRIYALNSNCASVGGCGVTSAQYAWLKADLAANPRRCVASYWHHPRFSSGPHGSSMRMAAIVQLLYDGGADLVVTGHDHLYERFAPMTPTGAADPARGMRHFVVGTGGAGLYDPESPREANSERVEADTHGVLKLTLSWSAYAWQFIDAGNAKSKDQGNATCH